jgi:methylaspartate ammonia-lyase
MLIGDVTFVVGHSGCFHKDLVAMQSFGHTRGPGFKSIIQPAKIISVILHLPGGATATGDCVDVILTGAASRDPLFVPEQHLSVLEFVVRPWLLQRDVSRFKDNAVQLDQLTVPSGDRLHTAVRYGLTQALLCATALVRKRTVAEIVQC